MGYRLTAGKIDEVFSKLAETCVLIAPKLFPGGGRFSDTDVVRYGPVTSVKEIVFDRKAAYSPKEGILPNAQKLFYFVENDSIESVPPKKNILLFLRSCDRHAVDRLDDMYLRNGQPDSYYARVRSRVHFALIGCPKAFDSCFCVDMGTNRTDAYDFSVDVDGENFAVDCKNTDWSSLFEQAAYKTLDIHPAFVTETPTRVHIPDDLSATVSSSKMWDEYNNRCIGCGRCNFVCPSCTCFTMQDLYYTDDNHAGERRRVWSSCMVDSFTDVAGGGSYRKGKGQRMRFKTLHKALFHKKRFGNQMCVGCGRCDDICPEYISFSHILNRLNEAMREVSGHDEK